MTVILCGPRPVSPLMDARGIHAPTPSSSSESSFVSGSGLVVDDDDDDGAVAENKRFDGLLVLKAVPENEDLTTSEEDNVAAFFVENDLGLQAV